MDDNMSNDTKVTFMCPEQLAELVGAVSFEIDKNKSEIIRTCLLLGIDTVRSNPSLVNRLNIGDRKEHQISAR